MELLWALGRMYVAGVGLVYPAVQMSRSLSTNTDRDLLARCIKHYIVISLFCALEVIVDVFLFWLPFVNVIKVAAVTMLVAGDFKGAAWAYDRLALPFLKNHAHDVDALMRTGKEYATFAIEFFITFVTALLEGRGVAAERLAASRANASDDTVDVVGEAAAAIGGTPTTPGIQMANSNSEDFVEVFRSVDGLRVRCLGSWPFS